MAFLLRAHPHAPTPTGLLFAPRRVFFRALGFHGLNPKPAQADDALYPPYTPLGFKAAPGAALKGSQDFQEPNWDPKFRLPRSMWAFSQEHGGLRMASMSCLCLSAFPTVHEGLPSGPKILCKTQKPSDAKGRHRLQAGTPEVLHGSLCCRSAGGAIIGRAEVQKVETGCLQPVHGCQGLVVVVAIVCVRAAEGRVAGYLALHGLAWLECHRTYLKLCVAANLISDSFLGAHGILCRGAQIELRLRHLGCKKLTRIFNTKWPAFSLKPQRPQTLTLRPAPS